MEEAVKYLVRPSGRRGAIASAAVLEPQKN